MQDDRDLKGRVSAALDEAYVEPDAAFERRARNGALERIAARRGRRAAGVMLVFAGAAAILIWRLDRPVRSLPRPVGTSPPAVAAPPLQPAGGAEELRDFDDASRSLAPYLPLLEEGGADGLTAAQQAAIDQAIDQAQKDEARAEADAKVLRIDLRRELRREAPDLKKVSELADRLAVAEGRPRAARLVAALQVKGVLTAGQRSALEKRAARKAVEKAPLDAPVAAEDGAPDGDELAALSIATRPPARVFLDGKDTGRGTPLRMLKVTPGRHVVTLVDPTTGRKVSMVVDLKPGEDAQVIKDLSSEGAR